MILMQAPGPKMNFGSQPSGANYISDNRGLIYIVNNSVADQLSLESIGCATLAAFWWGNAGFTTLTDLYNADTSTNIFLPGLVGYPEHMVATVFNDAGNSGTWSKTASGAGAGNWTQQSPLTLASLSALVTLLLAAVPWYAASSFAQVPQLRAAIQAAGGTLTVTNYLSGDPTDPAWQEWDSGGTCTQTGPLGTAIKAALGYTDSAMTALFAAARGESF